MHPNAELITRFYSAFAAGDHGSIARSCPDEARFSDPVFPNRVQTQRPASKKRTRWAGE